MFALRSVNVESMKHAARVFMSAVLVILLLKFYYWIQRFDKENVIEPNDVYYDSAEYYVEMYVIDGALNFTSSVEECEYDPPVFKETEIT